MISWPKFEKPPSNESNAVGDAVRKMTDAALVQSAANQRHLQQALAAEARRRRQESIDAARSMPADAFNSFPPEKKEE